MARGARRAGARVKSNAELADFRALIDEAVGREDWLAILKAMAEEAKGQGKGAGDAREFLVKYRWELPAQAVESDPPVRPIEIIEVASKD